MRRAEIGRSYSHPMMFRRRFGLVRLSDDLYTSFVCLCNFILLYSNIHEILLYAEKFVRTFFR